MAVVIYGSVASGKTRYAEQYKTHFGCNRIIEEWDGKTLLEVGDLALTQLNPPYSIPTSLIVPVEEAKDLVTS